MDQPIGRRLLAEFLGSAFLAAVVIGSGIAAQQLSHDTGLRLLENAAATAAGLFAIILMFGPVSGGHFNPVVSLVDAAFGGLSWRDALAYIPAQIAGCVAGAVAANAMFALSAISISTHHRASPSHLLAEVIATLGLLLVIFALARSGRGATAPAAVGAYIGAAYWFTSSTSFANPAITVGRMFSDTFAGIAPASVPAFVIAQLAGGAVAFATVRALYPGVGPATAAEVVVPTRALGRPAGSTATAAGGRACRARARRLRARAPASTSARRADSMRRGPTRAASSASSAARWRRPASIAAWPRAVSASCRTRASPGSRRARDVAAPLEVRRRLGDGLLGDPHALGERADRQRAWHQVLEERAVGEAQVVEAVGGDAALDLVRHRPAGEERGQREVGVVELEVGHPRYSTRVV